MASATSAGSNDLSEGKRTFPARSCLPVMAGRVGALYRSVAASVMHTFRRDQVACGWEDDAKFVQVQSCDRRLLGRLVDHLDADPGPAVARHGVAQKSQLQRLLDVGWIEHGNRMAGHRLLA